MKKVIEFLKANRAIIMISAIIVLLVIVLLVWGGTDNNISVNAKADKTETELKLERILSSIDGVGDTDVMVTEGENGISGVVIVCRGANNIMTRSDILNAVSTALNISKNIIAIYAMN